MSKKDGKIITDLYKKECDRNQYLLTSSIHPIECFHSIPYSLCMQINIICNEEEAREKRFMGLKNTLLDRGYTPGIIDAAIAKARAIPRQEALMCVSRQDVSDRPTFMVSYDPRLPSLPPITRKHWRSMVSQNKYLEEVFPSPPPVAYKKY